MSSAPLTRDILCRESIINRSKSFNRYIRAFLFAVPLLYIIEAVFYHKYFFASTRMSFVSLYESSRKKNVSTNERLKKEGRKNDRRELCGPSGINSEVGRNEIDSHIGV